MDEKDLWINFLNLIKEKLVPIAFDAWFSETRLHKVENKKMYIIVPMNLHKKNLSETYYDIIKENMNKLTGTNFDFEFLLEEEINDKKIDKIEEGVPFNNPIQANLNSNYTFDTFVIGETNRMAFTAAFAVAERPGKAYNPLFLYGSSGLGKTHLMHAIGNYIVSETNKKVLYITSDKFKSDFIAINKRKHDENNMDNVDSFKNKYRNIDVLIIDDIQFLAGATESQTEFFHTFNELHQEGKQIIISSDRSPDDLKLLEERLRTRFNWGLAVNIFPPDYELRIEILKKKISAHEVAKPISEDVLIFIANNCTSDVRKLEGALNRLFAYTVMFNKEKIELDVAKEALSDFLNSNSYMKNNIQKIQKIVCDYYQITLEDMNSKKRNKNFVLPRQVAMFLSRNLTEESFPRIGIEFGGRDHTTVIHSCNKIEEEIKKDKDFKNSIDLLKKKLK
ncbi:MAG: chromosomal replication initiator protein DnaA [Tenericutes bacterium]|nr:chromosomal replication initiator protein DnaA [Mycoplasmatota bacterium]